MRPARWLALGPPECSRPLISIESRAWHEWHQARGIEPSQQRPKLPAWKRRRVLERDGFLCGLCGSAVEPDDVHIDHVEPLSLGGSSELDNLQVAHSLCNMRKGNRV